MVKILPISTKLYSYTVNQQHLQNNNTPSTALPTQSERVELSFCGDIHPNLRSVDLSPALNSDGVHCPVCGVQTLSEDSLNKLLSRAEKLNNAGELIELLNEYENYIPSHMRDVLVLDSEKFKNPYEMPIDVYHKRCRKNAFAKLCTRIVDIKDYLSVYSESLPNGVEKDIIDEVNRGIKLSGLPSRACIGRFFNSESVDFEAKQYVGHVLLPSLNSASSCFSCFVENINGLSQGELAKAFINNIFSNSQLKVVKVQSGETFINSPNNSVLVCSSCADKSPAKMFMNFHTIKNPALAKSNLVAYLGDVAKLMGEGTLFPNRFYFNNFVFYISKLSKGEIEFSETEVNRLHNLRSMVAKRENFAPIEQTKVDVPCPDCGSIMLPHAIRLNIQRDLLVANDLQDYFEVLKKYDKYIGSHATDSRNIFYNIISENPEISMEDFLEIFNQRIERIAKGDTYLALDEFKKSIDYVRAEGTREQLDTILYVKEQLENYLEKGWFKDYNYTNLLNNVVDIDLDSPDCSKGIYMLLNNMKSIAYKMSLVQPVSTYDNQDKDPVYTILFNLFKSDVATADYLVAAKKGGKNTKDNLIGMCKGCNTLKNNKGVSAWYAQNINVRKNFHKHLEVVDAMAKDGVIEGYNGWARSIADTMYKLTNHKYDIRHKFKKD